jgi:2-dehydro-3-deoxygluconokinase
VVRVPGRLPGLYVIDIGDKGERRFFYWRQNSAARLLFELPETSEIAAALPRYDLIYLTGVSLSLYGETGRARLFDVLDRARAQGRRVAFDTNFRPRGWPDVEVARLAYREALQRSDMVLASSEDLELLFGNDGLGELPLAILTWRSC